MTPEPSRIWMPRRKRLCAPPMAFAMAHASMGSQVPGSVQPPDIPGLVLWLRADLGITYVQGPVVATGTTPPTVTLSGTPTSATNTIEIDITGIGILGVALFSWKWNGVVQQTAQVTAASFPLAGTGITAAFGAGTYAANDVYTSVVTVSAWADQSVGGNNVTQGTASAQPSFGTATGPRSTPAIGFVAANSQQLNGATSPFASGTSATIFSVSATTSTSTYQTIYEFGGSVAFGYAFGAGGGKQRILQAVGINQGFNSTPTVSSGAFEKWTVQSASGPLQSLRVNGSAVTISPNSFTPGAVGASQSIGGGSILALQGSICEIVGYNTVLSAAQILQVEAYLLARYGI